MRKTVTFIDTDKTLIYQLQQYQKQKKLPSLVAVVRELYKDALTLKKISR